MTTTSLYKRWHCHKCDYNKDNNTKCSIYPYIIKYGVENFKIILIKEYEVYDNKQLKVYETLWINKLNSINPIPSFNPLWKGNFKKKMDNFHYEKNKEKIKENVKNYANNNKDLIKERSKKYREKKSENFKCNCGGSWSKGDGIKRHQRTLKHQKYLNEN